MLVAVNHVTNPHVCWLIHVRNPQVSWFFFLDQHENYHSPFLLVQSQCLTLESPFYVAEITVKTTSSPELWTPKIFRPNENGKCRPKGMIKSVSTSFTGTSASGPVIQWNITLSVLYFRTKNIYIS